MEKQKIEQKVEELQRQSQKIKQETENCYRTIEQAEQRLETLRQQCPHMQTFVGNYMWRVGSIHKAEICSFCGKLIKYVE